MDDSALAPEVSTATAHAPWPADDVDLPRLHGSGWRPTPFHDVVLKVHQRCNLICDYCYIYTMADQSWRDRPVVMAPETWRAAAARLAEHVATHRIADVRVILHGGEPLLAGARTLTALIADFRAALDHQCDVKFQLQTNGVLLDEDMLSTLDEQRVTIGVSLDGAAADNDRRRQHLNGRGSHAAVDRALRMLTAPEHRRAFGGLLCTIDPATDPVTSFEALLRYEPPAVDLLLPHANWVAPPSRATPTPHGDWLVAVFDRWYGAARQETRVRLFEDVISLVLGGGSRSEQVGLSPVAVVVVETDGAIEQVDSLKSAYPGACMTGLNIFDDALDAALHHPGIMARQMGLLALSSECRACPLHDVCGGGHYAHRYRPDTGFRNPSVYCADMARLIDHISRRIAREMQRRLAVTGR